MGKLTIKMHEEKGPAAFSAEEKAAYLKVFKQYHIDIDTKDFTDALIRTVYGELTVSFQPASPYRGNFNVNVQLTPRYQSVAKIVPPVQFFCELNYYMGGSAYDAVGQLLFKVMNAADGMNETIENVMDLVPWH